MEHQVDCEEDICHDKVSTAGIIGLIAGVAVTAVFAVMIIIVNLEINETDKSIAVLHAKREAHQINIGTMDLMERQHRTELTELNNQIELFIFLVKTDWHFIGSATFDKKGKIATITTGKIRITDKETDVYTGVITLEMVRAYNEAKALKILLK